jgi:hypothetical protein
MIIKIFTDFIDGHYLEVVYPCFTIGVILYAYF